MSHATSPEKDEPRAGHGRWGTDRLAPGAQMRNGSDALLSTGSSDLTREERAEAIRRSGAETNGGDGFPIDGPPRALAPSAPCGAHPPTA